MPWALVKLDEDAGTEAQKKWLFFREMLLALDAAAVDAARYRADEDDVLLAVTRLEQALDDLVEAVPEGLRV